MSKHRRARSTGPTTSATSRRIGYAATVGLLTFTGGWMYALVEQPGAPWPRQTQGSSDLAENGSAADAKSASGTHGGQDSRADRSEERAAGPNTAGLPGLSAATAAKVPADSRQLVLVTGKDAKSSHATVTLYTRPTTNAPWAASGTWPARNGAKGWSADGARSYGDLTSPQGVFSLSDAGGLLAAPKGTRLPYDRDSAFVAGGRGVEGESLAGSFDYVIAIDFNRAKGVSPLDPTKPEGAAKGGNIWLHVDHDGPSQGCVGLPKEGMRALLATLDPAARPVVVMGPAGF
ncbi:hypothetical protein ACN20G_09960 [Streptomyces sp. BI20]|uniref:L,D-transpeptidase family protein n=1 Tax=Streptomyces sp. BI20 TaxID=3403460 RepID=UPI003C75C73F